ERERIKPMYEQKAIPAEEKKGKLRLVASPRGGNGSNAVKLYQDAELYATELEPGQSVSHGLGKGRHAWVQAIRGSVTVNGHHLQAGDGAAISAEPRVEIAGLSEQGEALLFDLA